VYIIIIFSFAFRYLTEKNKYYQFSIETAVNNSFIGSTFWFGFNNIVSNSKLVNQCYYELQPILHECSFRGGLVAQQLLLVATDHEGFIPVVNRMLSNNDHCVGYNDYDIQSLHSSDIEEFEWKIMHSSASKSSMKNALCIATCLNCDCGQDASLFLSFTRSQTSQLLLSDDDCLDMQSDTGDLTMDIRCLSIDDLFSDSVYEPLKSNHSEKCVRWTSDEQFLHPNTNELRPLGVDTCAHDNHNKCMNCNELVCDCFEQIKLRMDLVCKCYNRPNENVKNNHVNNLLLNACYYCRRSSGDDFNCSDELFDNSDECIAGQLLPWSSTPNKL